MTLKVYLSGEIHTDWREQISLNADGDRRMLVCACTVLPGSFRNAAGYVLVFDDVTELVKAQRDAAWGEVARRLAHEIKNPLTPIQLSAERMRRKYLDSMTEEESRILDRATHTIVQQVEAMKEMVNAFSEYARAPDIDLSLVAIDQLVQEVVELYRAQESRVKIGPVGELALDGTSMLFLQGDSQRYVMAVLADAEPLVGLVHDAETVVQVGCVVSPLVRILHGRGRPGRHKVSAAGTTMVNQSR